MSRQMMLAGHLRTSFVLGTGVLLVSVWGDVFRAFANESQWHPLVNALGLHWPLHLGLGAIAFGLLAAPAVVSALLERRLERRLRDRRLLPRGLVSPLLPWPYAATLCIVTAGIAILLPFLGELAWAMKMIEREAITLPLAYAAKRGLPPRPRIIVNILPDGEVRIEGVSYSDRPYLHMRGSWGWKEDQGMWGFASSPPRPSYPYSMQAMANMLAARAKERMGPDGYSTMSVYICADADVPFKRIEEVFRACKQAKIFRVSFGVSPRDAWPERAPLRENAKPSAIRLRQELPVQRKRILSLPAPFTPPPPGTSPASAGRS